MTPRLREAVVFTTQNLLTAPPFSNLDLISCRNVLIYFEPEAQDRVLSLFAFALKPGGALFLGKSDSILGHSESFTPITKKGRLYRRTAVPHHAPARFEVGAEKVFALGQPKMAPQHQQPALFSLPPQLLLNHFGASLVLIDPRGLILSFYGESEKYLTHPTGLADLNIFTMARARLAGRLRVGVRQALAREETVRLERVPVVTPEGSATVDVAITPHQLPDAAEKVLAVIFQERRRPTWPPHAEPGLETAVVVEQLEADLRAEPPRSCWRRPSSSKPRTSNCGRCTRKPSRSMKNCSPPTRNWRPRRRSCSLLTRNWRPSTPNWARRWRS